MTANGVRSGRLNPRDGRIGPRGLRRGAVTAEVQRKRRALLETALEACEGDWAAAAGMLVGCVEELAFRVADDAGPPSRPKWTSAESRAVGDSVLQPTSRILRHIASAFRDEADLFRRWSGEHIDVVQSRIAEASHLFGAEVAKCLSTMRLRGEERDGQPMSREEFDEELFAHRARELEGRAFRCQPHGTLGALYLVIAVAEQLAEELRSTGQGEEVREAFAVLEQVRRFDPTDTNVRGNSEFSDSDTPDAAKGDSWTKS